jgi:hypothetical protein
LNLAVENPTAGRLVRRRPLASFKAARLAGWLTLPMGLWLLAWLSINTGPWDIGKYGVTLASSITALRAAATGALCLGCRYLFWPSVFA